MFHFSKFGLFSNTLKDYADKDGYVPEKDDRLEDFNFSSENTQQEWQQYVDNVVSITAIAQQKLEQWQTDNQAVTS